MHDVNNVEPLKPDLKHKVKESTEEDVMLCYQCGKCSAGCPLIDEMDIAPNQILRMLQTEIPELEERVLKSLTIWLCLTCEQCYARCPKDVDLPKIMDYLRSESIRRGLVNPKAKDILAFHKSFLDSVRLTGKLYEIGLIGGYKMRTMHLMQDVNVAPTMYINGKLNLFPSQVKNKKAIQRIFEKAQSEEENK